MLNKIIKILEERRDSAKVNAELEADRDNPRTSAFYSGLAMAYKHALELLEEGGFA